MMMKQVDIRYEEKIKIEEKETKKGESKKEGEIAI